MFVIQNMNRVLADCCQIYGILYKDGLGLVEECAM